MVSELLEGDTVIKNTDIHKKVDDAKLAKALDYLSKIVKDEDKLAKMQQELVSKFKHRQTCQQ
jgi:hypothetical protein